MCFTRVFHQKYIFNIVQFIFIKLYSSVILVVNQSFQVENFKRILFSSLAG